MGKVLVFQDERIVQLMREVRRHPKLMEQIKAAQETGANATTILFTDTRGEDLPVINTFDELIGFLAAKTDILLHGVYTHEELCVLCERIRERLAKSRVVIIQ